MIQAKTYRVKLQDDGSTRLYDDRDSLSGVFTLEQGGHWAFRDPTGRPQATAAVGEILHDIPPGWPAPVSFDELATKICDQGGREFAVYLVWAPALIAAVYAESPEAQARLALLLVAVLTRYDDAGLLPTRLRLERQAYQALSAVYEAEPDTSGRRTLLAEALRRALRVWRAAIMADDLAWCFGPAEPQAGREAEMWDLLCVPVNNRPRLRRLFREPADGRAAVRRAVERWHLPRYDLAGAERLKQALHSLTPDGRGGGYLPVKSALVTRVGQVSEWLSLVALLALAGFWLSGAQASVNLGQAAPSPLFWLVYVACGAAPVLIWLLGGTPDTSTPRLLAGILVALVGVILQQNWGGLARFAEDMRWLAAGLGLVIVVAAFRVLLGKVRRALGTDWPPAGLARRDLIGLARAGLRDLALRRTAALWRRGLAAAFLLSLVVSDLLGDIYLAQTPDLHLIRLPGAVGHIYPGLTVLFTALMLFAGVFVQLLWEDRPITEGIT